MSSQTYGCHNQAGDRHIYIAVPTYNSSRFLRPLASYLRTCEKILGLSLHIHISDNGSTDKSCFLIQELLACGLINTARFHSDRFNRGIENFYSCALAFLRSDPDPSTVFLHLHTSWRYPGLTCKMTWSYLVISILTGL
jgi:glycosyltransferase involved in cell wall biosynthesis